MTSMRDIKRRRNSVQSTQQITKAMKLVSTVKLQRARHRAEQSKLYFDYMYQTVSSILARSGSIRHKFLQSGSTPKKAAIVISSNRGLVGGYNSNIVKLITGQNHWKKEDVQIWAVGNRGRESLLRAGYEVKQDFSEIIENPTYKDAREIAELLLTAYEKHEMEAVYLAYTRFVNTVSHVPALIRLLPIEVSEKNESALGADLIMNFEMEEEQALNLIVPKYVTSMIYGALVEAAASENGARMQAMDSATDNAEEMIRDLTIEYNRARQSSITQELTEIIAGAEAIS